jgi:putative inorganic carbon (HCO3(-)) transporter
MWSACPICSRTTELMTNSAQFEHQTGRALAACLPGAASIRSASIRELLRQVTFAILITRAVCDPLFGLSSTDFGESTISLGAAANALTIAAALAFVILGPSRMAFTTLPMWAPFLLSAFAATLYAPQFISAARLFLLIVSYWAMFALPFFMFRSRADLPWFVLLIFASSIIPSLYALWDILRGLSDLGEFRLESTFMHPNIFAFYLVLLLGLALYVRTTPATLWPAGARRAITFYIPVLLAFLVLTQTRSAWGACALMFLFYALWFDRRLLLVGLLVVPIMLSSQTIGSRVADAWSGEEIESFKELNENKWLNSYAWREALWTSALPAIGERPVLGHGLQSFRSSSPQFFPLAGLDGTDAHNLYLQILFEMGAIGMLTYAWLLFCFVRSISEGLRYDSRGIVIVLAILGTYVLESYSDNMVYYLNFNWYFMFALGTICAWVEYERGRRRTTNVRPHAIAG